MSPDLVKQLLLDYGWDAAERQRIAQLMHALETHPESEQAVEEYDRLREALCVNEEGQPVNGWSQFTADLLGSLPQPVAPGRWWRVPAMAAALVAGALLGWCGRTASEREQPAPVIPIPIVRDFSAQEIAGGASVFREVAAVFEQRARWVLVADRVSDVGLSGDVCPTGDRLFLLRLMVYQADKLVSSADLLILPGQEAELVLPFERGNRLQYQVTASADASPRVSLWSEVLSTDTDGRSLAALATELPVQSGQVHRVGEMATSLGRYAVKIAFAQTRLSGGGA